MNTNAVINSVNEQCLNTSQLLFPSRYAYTNINLYERASRSHQTAYLLRIWTLFIYIIVCFFLQVYVHISYKITN